MVLREELQQRTGGVDLLEASSGSAGLRAGRWSLQSSGDRPQEAWVKPRATMSSMVGRALPHSSWDGVGPSNTMRWCCSVEQEQPLHWFCVYKKHWAPLKLSPLGLTEGVVQALLEPPLLQLK